ncbi:hypothetical protein B0E41_23075 [Hydrogenophaga sp. A37]|nr:hypothetical protein B0E41_23075 [Hydrogenophaga sp. A37]
MLLAWERGLNLGHLVRVQATVWRLQAQRLRVTLAVSPAIAARYGAELKTLSCEQFVVREPRHSMGWCAPMQLSSFAGVLAAQGWTDGPWLTGALAAWQRLFSVVKPACVVLDYAPLACLTAWLSGVPALHVSSGFDAPPPDHTGIGRFRSSTGEVSAAEMAETTSVNTILHQVLRSFGTRRNIRLRDLFSYPRLLLDCIPQTDPYGCRVGEVYAPFFSEPGKPHAAHWPESVAGQEVYRIFVYIRENAIAPSLLTCLLQASNSVVCFWPDHDSSMYDRHTQGLVIHTEPVELHPLFETASLIVGYGSVGISTRAVLANVPQLIFPTDLEKQMVGRRIQKQGLGICLEPGWDASALQQAYERLRFDEGWSRRSAAIGAHTLGQRVGVDYFGEVLSFVESALMQAQAGTRSGAVVESNKNV